MTINRQIILTETPQGTLTSEHFELKEVAMPVPAENEVLLRTLLMSIDAANRAWMQGATYRDGVMPGDPMATYSVCEVIESNSPKLKQVKSWPLKVIGPTTWRCRRIS